MMRVACEPRRVASCSEHACCLRSSTITPVRLSANLQNLMCVLKYVVLFLLNFIIKGAQTQESQARRRNRHEHTRGASWPNDARKLPVSLHDAGTDCKRTDFCGDFIVPALPPSIQKPCIYKRCLPTDEESEDGTYSGA